MAPTTNNKNTQSNTDRERRKAAGSAINAFAEQKGVTRSIRNFKHRQETKQNIKASRLREYRKVMRKEGMEAGRGGGRRRRDDDDDDDTKNKDEPSTKEGDDAAPIRHKKKPKMNPLTKSLQKKQLLLDQQQEDRLQHRVDAKQSEKRQKQRHRQAKLLSRKTQRGQPVMKHMINSLLVKLEDK
jgi:hypothetical protein